MRILYTAKSPLAGVCELMALTVNKYCRPACEARVLNAGPGKHAWYKRDPKLVPCYSIKNPDHVRECVEWADVIHGMANVGVRSCWFKGMDRAKLLRDKVWVHQWHGAQIWPFEQIWDPADYPSVKFIHIGQGWVQRQMDFFGEFIDKHGMRTMPNIITADDKLHTPKPWNERKNRTAFSPSQHRESAVNRKGIDVVVDACRHIPFNLITNSTFERCLTEKAKCKLGVDEVVTPMYHRSGLEFLALGIPCICSMADETMDTLREATDCSRIPFINATPGTLREVVLDYWNNVDDMERKDAGRRAREWIDEYYHPRQLIERYIDLYEGA